MAAPDHSAILLASVRDSAREGEPDRYLAALLSPAAIASDLMILAGLGAELARIPSQIKEPMMGEIRVQWWRDAIAGAARGEASGQATADAVGGLLARHAIAASRLDPLFDACLIDIGRELPADDAALLAHLDGRDGTLFGLALAVAGVAGGTDADATALAAGRAYGLARSLGRLPYHLARGGFPIPATRLDEAGVSGHDLAVRPVPAATAEAVARASAVVRARARQDLAEARTRLASLGAAARPALLPLATVEPYFAVQERHQSAALNRVADLSPLGRFWRLWRAHRTGRI